MPVPALNVVEGVDIVAVLDSLEKQRKELMFILENLDTSNVNGFDATVINAGTINGKHLHIDSTVSFGEGYDTTGLRSEMTTQFSVVDGEIKSKVSQTHYDAFGVAVNNAFTAVTQTTTEIILEAGKQTTRLDGHIESSNASIKLNADEIKLRVEKTDYNGNTIASLINQTATTIDIQASKINLVGAVSVLSDITGGLGTITAGTIYGVNIESAYIDIYETISVGNGVYLRGGRTGVYFEDGSQVYSQGGAMTLEAWNDLNIVGYPTRFYGSVDFSYADVYGLDIGSSTTFRYSSTSNRLYVDIYGSNVGYLNVY